MANTPTEGVNTSPKVQSNGPAFSNLSGLKQIQDSFGNVYYQDAQGNRFNPTYGGEMNTLQSLQGQSQLNGNAIDTNYGANGNFISATGQPFDKNGQQYVNDYNQAGQASTRAYNPDKWADIKTTLGMLATPVLGGLGIPGMVGDYMGLSGALGSAAGGAIVGGGIAGLTGQDIGKGALLGGVGGYTSGSGLFGGGNAEPGFENWRPNGLDVSQVGNSILDPQNTETPNIPTNTNTPNIPETPETPYSNEGRNYPTPNSTQGPGGSPVNASLTGTNIGTAALAGTAGLPTTPGGSPALSSTLGSTVLPKIAGAVAGGVVTNALTNSGTGTPTGNAATGGQSLIDLANVTAKNNLDMAKYTTNVNRFNQSNQYGSSNWAYVPQYDKNGNETGGGWTQTTTLNPEQQALFNSQTAGNQGLSDTANTALKNSSQLSNPNLDLSKLPGYKGIDLNALPAAAITPGTTAYNAMMARLQPQLSQSDNALAQRLANQGITLGSEAYNREMNLAGQNRNDLQLQAAAQGISLDQAARQQALGEQQALYNQTSSQRGQMLNEQQAAINTPLNTINALRTGSQVQQPTFTNQGAQQANVAGADALTAGSTQQTNALNAQNANKANTAGLYGSLAQLGTAAMLAPTGTFSGAQGLFS
jgi:hypothetical protein